MSSAASTPHDPYKVNALDLSGAPDPLQGTVVWSPARSLWNGGMLLGAVVVGRCCSLGTRSSCFSRPAP